jgi:hypothetical protein
MNKSHKTTTIGVDVSEKNMTFGVKFRELQPLGCSI